VIGTPTCAGKPFPSIDSINNDRNVGKAYNQKYITYHIIAREGLSHGHK